MSRRLIAPLALLVAGLLLGAWWMLREGSAHAPPRAARPLATPGEAAGERASREGALPGVVSAADGPARVASEPEAPTAAAAEAGAGAPAGKVDLRIRFDGLRGLVLSDPVAAAEGLRAFIDETADAPQVQLQRLAAIALLGEIRAVPTAPDLIALHAAGDGATRRAAALALERQGDPSLVLRELNVLQADFASEDGGVRMRAVQQAARLGSPQATPYLLPMLGDGNSAVRVQALEGLRLAGDASVVPQVEALLDDPVALVRERAERTLAALRPGPAGGER